MSLEKELRDQLAYELSDIEGFSGKADALVAACELAAAVQAFGGLGLTVRGWCRDPPVEFGLGEIDAWHERPPCVRRPVPAGRRSLMSRLSDRVRCGQ